MASIFKEIGQTGLRRSGGFILEEYDPDLKGRKWFVKGREMMYDPTIAAFLFAIEMLIRRVEWDVEAASESPRDQENADFVKACLLTDMSQPFTETVAEILSFIPWGWSYMEVVYKRRQGPNNNPALRSQFNDGLIGWRKFAIRAQESLVEWGFDDAGGITGLTQAPPPDYGSIFIPIQKALLFRITSHKGNPEGVPLLRRIYRAYYFKHNFENLEGIGIERNLAGFPVFKIPAKYMAPGAPAEFKEMYEYCKQLVVSARRDEYTGFVIPSDRDAKGNELFKFELLAPQGSAKEIDTDKAIRRWDQRILMVMMADFLMLGSEKVGSYALSTSKSDMFTAGLEAITDSIAAVINRHAIPKLLRLNGRVGEPLPQLTHSKIEKVNLELLAKYLVALTQAGIGLNAAQQRFLLDQGGFPVTTEDDDREDTKPGQAPAADPNKPDPEDPDDEGDGDGNGKDSKGQPKEPDEEDDPEDDNEE